MNSAHTDAFKSLHNLINPAASRGTGGKAASHLDHYVVVRHEGEWKIAHNDSLSARYRTKQEALLDAIRRAQKSAGRG